MEALGLCIMACSARRTCCLCAITSSLLPNPLNPIHRPPADPLDSCSFEDLIVTIDALLVEGEEPSMAPPPPLISAGPCKEAADMAAAAAALNSVAPVTPN